MDWTEGDDKAMARYRGEETLTARAMHDFPEQHAREHLDQLADAAHAHIADLQRRLKNLFILDLVARSVAVDLLLAGTPRVWVNGKECVEVDALTVPY